MNSISAQHMSGPPNAIVLVGPRPGIALPGQLDVVWCSATTANSRNTGSAACRLEAPPELPVAKAIQSGVLRRKVRFFPCVMILLPLEKRALDDRAYS